jgi:hypothetical protein
MRSVRAFYVGLADPTGPELALKTLLLSEDLIAKALCFSGHPVEQSLGLHVSARE